MKTAQDKIEQIQKELSSLLRDPKLKRDISIGLETIAANISEMSAQLNLKNRELEMLQSNLNPKTHFGFLFSRNIHMQKMFLTAELYKDGSQPIIILAEKGCGKESLARMIHMRSARTGHFIVGDVSLSLDNLLKQNESTLYIGDISLITPVKQKTILEYLSHPLSSNAQLIISAEKWVDIEPDIIVQLKGLILEILPLRKRREDIPPFIDLFIREFTKNEKNLSHLSTFALKKLLDYPWPGNMSELKMVLKKIFLDHPDQKTYGIESLPEKIVDHSLKETYAFIKTHTNLFEALELLEKKMVLEALTRYQGNKSKVCRELGISRSGLIHKVEEYKINLN